MTESALLPSSDEVLTRARAALETNGEHAAARVVGLLRLQIDPQHETWSLGGRTVRAYRAALLASQRQLLSLRESAVERETIRAAVRAAFDTRERVLRELSLALDADTLGVPRNEEVVRGHPYRQGEHRSPPPSPAVLREAASKYARAMNDAACAELFERAKLQCEPAAPLSSDRRACYRVHVLVSLDDLAATSRDRSMRKRIVDVVRAVGTGLDHAIGDVKLVPWLEGVREAASSVGASRQRAALLQELLAAEGLACVQLGEVAGAMRFVVHRSGRTAIVDLDDGDGFTLGQPLVPHVRIGADGADTAAIARRIRDMLRKG